MLWWNAVSTARDMAALLSLAVEEQIIFPNKPVFLANGRNKETVVGESGYPSEGQPAGWRGMCS